MNAIFTPIARALVAGDPFKRAQSSSSGDGSERDERHTLYRGDGVSYQSSPDTAAAAAGGQINSDVAMSDAKALPAVSATPTATPWTRSASASSSNSAFAASAETKAVDIGRAFAVAMVNALTSLPNNTYSNSSRNSSSSASSAAQRNPTGLLPANRLSAEPTSDRFHSQQLQLQQQQPIAPMLLDHEDSEMVRSLLARVVH